MNKKVHKLAGFQEDVFYSIGISSHENDYRISWALNQALDLKLVREEDLEVTDSKSGALQHFSLFNWRDENKMVSYRLLANQGPNGYLLKTFKNIDFVFLLKGETDEAQVSEIVQKINRLDMVGLAFRIDPDKLTAANRKRLNF